MIKDISMKIKEYNVLIDNERNTCLINEYIKYFKGYSFDDLKQLLLL